MAKPNVVLITFDCLRPGRLGFAGYRGVETPTFDQMAAESLVFDRAYCQGPNTWVSHASMFTGCYPSRHGVRTPLDGLPGQLVTLPMALSEAGYATFGLPAMSLLGEEAGFARGFQSYTMEGILGPVSRFGYRGFRNNETTLKMAFDCLDRAPEPFFLWVHHFGIHRLYPHLMDLPASYRRRYSEYAQYYDGKVSFADREFLRVLLDRVRKKGCWDNTAFVLWSDHGDNLSNVEHHTGRLAHNFDLAEEVVRILLMLRLPGGGLGGRRDEIVNSVDIFPTLCEVCGIRAPDTVQGRSILSPPERPEELTAYFENLCQGCVGAVRGRSKLTLLLERIHAPAPPSTSDLARIGRLMKKIRRELGKRVLGKPRRGHPPGPDAWWSAGEPLQVLEELLGSGMRRHTVVDPEAEALEAEQAGPFPDEDELFRLVAERGRGDGSIAHGPKLDRDKVAQRLQDFGYM